MTASTIIEDQEAFTKEQITDWRRRVKARRAELFRKGWKNDRPSVALRSRSQEQAFQFVLEWYEEYDEVVGRTRERARLDRLIEQGLDASAPARQKA